MKRSIFSSLPFLLLMADAAEGGTEVDPLSEAAGGINTEFPVLQPDRLLKFKVDNCTKSKSDKGTETFKIKVRLEQDSTFRDGKPARTGFGFNQTVNFTPSENFDIDSVKRQLALWMKATLGLEKAAATPIRAWINQPDLINGCVFQARTGVKKDKNGVYADSIQLTPIIPDGK